MSSSRENAGSELKGVSINKNKHCLSVVLPENTGLKFFFGVLVFLLLMQHKRTKQSLLQNAIDINKI